MHSVKLVRHGLVHNGDDGSDDVRAIEVEINQPDPASLQLRYRIIGEPHRIRMPSQNTPARLDGLWQHTCFEVFVKGSSNTYCELNFSPSRQWAAYCFDGYREGMQAARISTTPRIRVESLRDGFELEAVVKVTDLPCIESDGLVRLAVAAVIENNEDKLSYWALAHPGPDADFHHPDSFVLVLTDNQTSA